MTGRHRGRDYMNNPHQDDHSRERSPRPAGHRHHLRDQRPSPGFYHRSFAYTQQSGRLHPSDGTSDGRPIYPEEEEAEEEGYYRAAGASNDNPLYELQDEDSRLPSTGQGIPSNNPLYGHDPFQPSTSQAVCMTEFLRPRGPRRPQRPQNSNREVRETYEISRGRGSGPPQYEGSRPQSPPVKLPRRTGGLGLSNRQNFIPPARFSPVTPSSSTSSPSRVVSSARGTNQSQASITSAQLPTAQQRQFNVQGIRDLIAAIRSDQSLHLGESRRDGSREPRIAGDHDRYFAPRKGDIIIHFNPTPDDNKLLGYFDERKTMLRLQPGDKLVRIKYDNYKIPDHLMITSKLYIYCTEWIYLGKAVQTIKTA